MYLKEKLIVLSTNEIKIVSGADCSCYKNGQSLRGHSAADYQECWLKCCSWENDKNYDFARFSYQICNKQGQCIDMSDDYSCSTKPFKENTAQKAEGTWKNLQKLWK